MTEKSIFQKMFFLQAPQPPLIDFLREVLDIKLVPSED